jgi:hypothetical protein
MNETEIREKLEASIDDLATETWPATPSGIRHAVYLDPIRARAYGFTAVGAGCPMSAYNGPDICICRVPGNAISQSLVNQLTAHLGTLAAACEEIQHDLGDPDDLQASAVYAAENLELDIACYWSPGDWYQDSDSEIAGLMRQGHSVEEIVDILGTGDDFNGMVDQDTAESWMSDRCDEIREAAIEAVHDADDELELIDAAREACALHVVDFSGPVRYLVWAQRAREAGHGVLAEVLREAHTMDQAFEVERDDEPSTGPGAACYGCGQPIPDGVQIGAVYCGRCGEAGR